MDGPGQGDQTVAPQLYMDEFCARFAEAGEIDWNPYREKLWIRHPQLSRA